MRLGYIPPEDARPGGSRTPVREDEARFAAEHGFAVEINSWTWPAAASDWAAEERDRFDEHGVDVSAVGAWGVDPLGDDATEERATEERALDYAETVGADVFLTGTDVPQSHDGERAWDRGVDYYADLTDRVADRGMQIAFYVGHGNTLIDEPGDARRFLEAVPDADLKLDPCNLLQHGWGVPDTFHEFGDRIAHVHVKDGLRVDGELVDQCPAGYGDVPWGNVVDLLYLAGYDGTLSIEPHGEYWGHQAPDERRRQGILRAAETVAQQLLPADRPAAFE